MIYKSSIVYKIYVRGLATSSVIDVYTGLDFPHVIKEKIIIT